MLWSEAGGQYIDKMSVQELEEQLRELRARLATELAVKETLSTENERLYGEVHTQRSQREGVERRVVYTKEKKCSKFSGGSSLSVFEFLDDIDLALTSRELSTQEEADFIY